MNKLTIIRPDDWHVHLRDGEILKSVLPDTARRFGRAIVMPNLWPPVTTTEQAQAYRERILQALPANMKFEPLMTLYLTDKTSVEEIIKAKASGIVHGIKLYPAGATTNSESGVTSLEHCVAVFEAMEKHGLALLVHAEVTDTDVDVFDREKVFIERNMIPLLKHFPALRVVFEHITTRDAVEFVSDTPVNVAATITAHHLLLNRNAMFNGGIRPHHYCLPVLKREEHRLAVLSASISGNPKFFLGTDSAPHAKSVKEAICGCAGIYTAHAGIELYVEAFESAQALGKLEAFASFYGADFYGLPRNKESITLVKEPWTVPDTLPLVADELIPLRAGQSITWRLQE